jgi:hypothetical protein
VIDDVSKRKNICTKRSELVDLRCRAAIRAFARDIACNANITWPSTIALVQVRDSNFMMWRRGSSRRTFCFLRWHSQHAVTVRFRFNDESLSMTESLMGRNFQMVTRNVVAIDLRRCKGGVLERGPTG